MTGDFGHKWTKEDYALKKKPCWGKKYSWQKKAEEKRKREQEAERYRQAVEEQLKTRNYIDTDSVSLTSEPAVDENGEVITLAKRKANAIYGLAYLEDYIMELGLADSQEENLKRYLKVIAQMQDSFNEINELLKSMEGEDLTTFREE